MFRLKFQLFSLLLVFFVSKTSYSQIVLDADGPGNTYELITSVLAPGYNPIEVPDCNHGTFARHIDEVYDSDLNDNVFRFHIHVTDDDDRCINFDRQRNEIKSYDKSPDNLKAVEGETVIYKWKFKLDAGFQASPNFTHLHQLKSVGGLYSSMPMYTLTARKATPDRIELRYAETNSQTTLIQTDIAPFKGVWVEATETIKFGTNSSPNAGTYSLELKKVSNQTVLLSYSDNATKNWQTDADFVRPKWGIYRSLNNSQDLRDEEVLFANFSIEEVSSLSIDNTITSSFKLHPNPVKNLLHIENLNGLNLNSVIINDSLGKRVLKINAYNKKPIDISNFPAGIYFIILKAKNNIISRKKIVKI
ncbi:T9SS type A sorting domain-containing protein [Seonamhaeicola sp. ML3]|uniref:T9SS type A sorting domain-containing protein n=1 Tax=Seonamhaeicola sp. ML3 TaxID=2937786 RepID=UPI00200DB72E|nr:T9SS type A sorting domain-containing protein [Seonamhaeicola sp. ML3]